MNTELPATPEYIQTLQSQISQMSSDNSKALFVIDKSTLNRLVKVLIRDEQVRIASREFQRNKNPEAKLRGVMKKDLYIKPIFNMN
jgi:hypothetical protein